jgi:platelet-activating factor acetylhydrolase
MPIFPTIFPSLPAYPGPYSVGSFDIEVPLSTCREFSVTDTSVETILVRMFYPCEKGGKGRPTWLPQPSMEYAKGYATFLKQPVLPTSLAISMVVYNTTIPAIENGVPILREKLDCGKMPVMVFSHGLGGSRNAYSQWCGSMASHGIFVAAIEHRDGSAPISIVNVPSTKQSSVPYRRITEYNEHTRDYRTSQLAQRTYEVSKLVGLLRDINHGKLEGVTDDKKGLLDMFKGLLNTKKGEFIMAGHSFGAATTVAACKDKENVEASYPLKDEFKAAIMLDIWMMVLSPSFLFPLQRNLLTTATECDSHGQTHSPVSACHFRTIPEMERKL